MANGDILESECARVIAAHELHVYEFSSASHRSTINRLAELLEEDELEQATKLRYNHLRAAFLFRRGVRRLILAQYASCPSHALRFTRGTFGKPELVGENVKFSASCSGNIALLAVTKATAVGVDVQGPVNMVDSRTFDDSVAEIGQAVGVPACTDLAQRWCRIEAALKCVGVGLVAKPPSERPPCWGADLAMPYPYRAAVANCGQSKSISRFAVTVSKDGALDGCRPLLDVSSSDGEGASGDARGIRASRVGIPHASLNSRAT